MLYGKKNSSAFPTVLNAFHSLIKEIYFQYLLARKLKYEEEKIVLYAAVGSQWRQFGHPRKRPISSIILDEGVAERILYDVKEFIGIPYWYRERGIPYRRCYLLYGPTGCGKTAFITALAGELQCNICVVNLESGLSEDNLNQLVNNAPQQSIILLEDLDAFVSRVANDGLSRITFSGVCNILDGVASAEARILFITTNHLERLDPALIRPGRVDVKEYIGHASDFQLEQMYQRFYPEAGLAAAQEFIHEARKVNKPISMAMVQGFFMFYKNDAQGITKNVQQMWDL